MTKFNYFTNNRIYNEVYFQYPKVFIYGSKYKDLSEGAKLAYMLLKNELTKSIQHNQIDEQGFIYFEMTASYLSELMNCSERKVARVKSELEQAELLKQVKMGFDKATGKNKPNRLYLAELDVTEQDVYLMNKSAETLDNNGHAKMAGRSEISQNTGMIDNTGFTKNEISQKSPLTLDNSGHAKMAVNVYKYKDLDTNRHLIDTEQDLKQDQILLDNFVEIMKDESIATFIPERVLGLIKTFSGSYADAQQTVRTIHNAKNKAQKETGQLIAFEELENYGINADAGLYNTLLKAYQKQKTEQVGNIQNLIFVYVKNWFIEKPIAHKIQLDQENELPKVSVENWIKK